MLLINAKNDNIYFQIPNGSGELNTTEGWQNCQPFSAYSPGVSPRPLIVDSGLAYKGLTSLKQTPGDSNHAYGARAIAVVPGQDYLIRVAYRADRIWNSGWFVGVFERNSYPEGGWVTSGLGVGSERTRYTGFTPDNGCTIPVANQWHVSTFVYTPPPGIFWASPVISAVLGDNTSNCWFQFLDPLSPNIIDRNPIQEFRGVSATVSGASTWIYAVQQDKSLSIDRIVIRVNTAVGTVTTAPSISIGTDTPNYNDIMTNTVLTGAVTNNRVFNYPIVGTIPVLPANSRIFFKINTAAVGATTLTYDVNIYGQIN